MLRAITARVLQSQESPDAIPLTLHPGDVVQMTREHPDRPGYVWVDDGQISAGWVPRDLIVLDGGLPRMTAEYCSAELAVSPGDQLRLIWEDPKHGACWCEDAHSERGWVRAEYLQIEDIGA